MIDCVKLACLVCVFAVRLAHGMTPSQQPATARGAASAGKEVRGKVVVDGATAPRFSLPVMSPGRPVSAVPINPQADGTFTTVFPFGPGLVGAATGLPAGFSVKSAAYGAADLLRDPLNVASTDTAELVIVLNAPRMGSISGRVTGLKSTEGVRVVLRPATRGIAWEAPLNADGTFLLSKVYPGAYNLRVSYGGIVTAQSVTLANEDIKDVVIEMTRDRILIGHVLVESGVAPDVVLQAKNGAGAVFSSVGALVGQVANAGRTFKLRLLDGEYAISVPNPPAGYQIRSVSYGTADLLKEPLKLDGLGLWEIVVRLVPVAR